MTIIREVESYYYCGHAIDRDTYSSWEEYEEEWCELTKEEKREAEENGYCIIDHYVGSLDIEEITTVFVEK